MTIMDRTRGNLSKKMASRIRKDIVEMIHAAGSGHPGGSLSAADILATLYFEKMMINPKEPEKRDRDRFVLSKGHAAPALYATLSRRGYFDPSVLLGLRKMGSILQGHPDMRKVPGVDFSTGSLGQGFSGAVGMALANQLDRSSGKVYVLLGDGELNEGIVWEAAMAAGHYGLSNLIAIVDHNGLQIDGTNEEVMDLHPLDAKWSSFGWHVLMVDGHDHEALLDAYQEAEKQDRPVVLIANTVKGKGVSYMENQVEWHGKAPSDAELVQALKELGGDPS
ncbi:transketolase [Anaerotalea alkaliphila]|uniref:Transketolase n=1 Tax=Anaerotalea alkaliphila TaxID=2662126 RepID=A0A7X5HY42_9FIRM|nr:transketolase [Anaerotalea alkaliphila]NDL68651.1 transketolase [Anaerotalea alkaliphila]